MRPVLLASALLAACTASTVSSKRPTAAPPKPLAWGDPEQGARIAAAAEGMKQVVADFAKATKVPGIAVGIVANGKLVWFHGSGVRETASGAPVDEDTAFRIASMSKAFVSAAVLKLRDEGKLSLEDPAEKVLPELRGIVPATADSPRVTVRHLLSHASGLPEDNASADLRMPMSDAEFDRLLAGGLSFSAAPGTQFEYSNLAFALAGRVVTRTSGMRVQEYVTRRLLLPLGMTQTRWVGADVPEPHKAHGYGRKGSAMPSAGLGRYTDDAFHEEPELADGSWAAIGGLWTTPRDYARWVAFQLAAWPPRDEPDDGPVRRASIREAQQVQRAIPFHAERDDRGELDVSDGGYGFGWGVRSTCRFEHVVTHGGGLPGYGSYVVLLPDRGVGIFTMTNLTYTGGRKVALELANALDDQGLLPRRPLAPSPQLARARDRVLDLLASWNAERAAALLDVNYASYEPLDALEARLVKLRDAHGACGAGQAVEPENALRGRMRLVCARGELDMSIELTSDAPPRIQALVLEPAMPPSPALVEAAGHAVELLARWDDRAAAAQLSPGSDAPVRKLLARVAADQGACTMGRAIRGDGSTTATFRLTCERGENDLLVAVDPATGRIAKVTATTVARSMRCPR